MTKYDLPKSKSLVGTCAPAARTSFFALCEKENEPERNLTVIDLNCITGFYPVVDGDTLEKTFSLCMTSNSMDFAFVVDSGETLLGEIKFNVDRSIYGQLKNLLAKFKGTYRRMYSMVNGRFYNRSIVLFNSTCYEEAKNVLSRLDEAFQEDLLSLSMKLHFEARTLPAFMNEFF